MKSEDSDVLSRGAEVYAGFPATLAGVAVELASFRREVRGEMAAVCASVERLTYELRLSRHADDAGGGRGGGGSLAAAAGRIPPIAPVTPTDDAAAARASLRADERLLSTLRAERRAERATLSSEIARLRSFVAEAARGLSLIHI